MSQLNNGITETLSQREATHGDFRRVALTAQNLKNELNATAGKCNVTLSSVQSEALDMICSKLARIVCGNPNEPDHWHDIAGYASLAEKFVAPAVKK